MRFVRTASVSLMVLWSEVPQAQPACPAGQGRLQQGEPCIPSHLVNYLYCLGKSGDGKIEVKKRDDVTRLNQLEVTIGGKGSGVVIRGEGTGTIKKSEASRVVKELEEKLDPSLTKNCERFARPPRAALPSLPPFDEASGTANAEITLQPQNAKLWAKLSGIATAHVSDGGWMELILSANDYQCKPARVYKNWSSGNMHTATATCSIEIQPHVPYVFRLDAPNSNADAHTAKLSVNYWR